MGCFFASRPLAKPFQSRRARGTVRDLAQAPQCQCSVTCSYQRTPAKTQRRSLLPRAPKSIHAFPGQRNQHMQLQKCGAQSGVAKLIWIWRCKVCQCNICKLSCSKVGHGDISSCSTSLPLLFLPDQPKTSRSIRHKVLS